SFIWRKAVRKGYRFSLNLVTGMGVFSHVK
ncbi:MAG: hypothetical protein ACI96P_002521, partial [Candidatus Azotimanducaceae bacterium]